MPNGALATAGEQLAIASELGWVSDLLREGGAGELVERGTMAPTIAVTIEATREPFPTRGMDVLTRDAWCRDRTVVMVNACGSGFDVLFQDRDGMPTFTFRWRPPPRERVAARALRARFHLLSRAVLVQYPALWCAGIRGRAPLHAPAFTSRSVSPLLAGPSGVGKSTVLTRELAEGAHVTCDNVSVGDGTTVWGLVEPMRVEGGSGRRMYHGRSEVELRERIAHLDPDRVMVVRRGEGAAPVVRSCEPGSVERSLVTGTYMAGELRRYWGFAATLAAGTGRGPAHPPVSDVARAFTRRLACFQIVLPRSADDLPPSLIPEMEAACR
jgi:hypothetical protein